MIYHIATQDDWARSSDSYKPARFDKDGFIHCSDAGQVIRISNQLFRGQKGLVLLEVDPTRLCVKTVYENLEGGNELFPHVYGPIKKSAVVRVFSLDPRVDGTFAFPRADGITS
jgi:uncharacterized protein (DUF952 family)